MNIHIINHLEFINNPMLDFQNLWLNIKLSRFTKIIEI